MEERKTTNMSHEEAEQSGWNILKPLDCEVVGKATYEKGAERIMKSTKRFEVEHEGVLLGWVYNTSTEYHLTGRVSVAEALVFVPVPSSIGALNLNRKVGE